MIVGNPFPVTNSMRRFAFGVAKGVSMISLERIRELPTLEAVRRDSSRSVALRLGLTQPRLVDAGPYGRRTVQVVLCAPSRKEIERNSKGFVTESGFIYIYLTPDMRRQYDDALLTEVIERIVLHELVHLFDPKVRREDLAHLRTDEDAVFALETVRGATSPGAMSDVRATASAPYGREAFGRHAAALTELTPGTRERIVRRLERAEAEAYYADPAEVDAYMTQAIWDLVKQLDTVEPRHLERAKRRLIDEARAVARHMATGRGHYVESSDMLRRWSKAGPDVWRRFVKGLVRAIEEYRRPRWAPARVLPAEIPHERV